MSGDVRIYVSAAKRNSPWSARLRNAQRLKESVQFKPGRSSPRGTLKEEEVPLWHCDANCCSHRARVGPVAQWLELTAHNRLVGGSSPSGPTNAIIYQWVIRWFATECFGFVQRFAKERLAGDQPHDAIHALHGQADL